jgi:hypothetical protein
MQCDCGALTGRYIVHFQSPDGQNLAQPYTTCPACRPAEFPPDVFAPSLDRLVTGPEAMPDKYKLIGDTLYASDELQQDTRDIITADGPTQQAIEHKRRTRRTEPATEEEIREQDRIWRQRLHPA